MERKMSAGDSRARTSSRLQISSNQSAVPQAALRITAQAIRMPATARL